MKVTTEWQEGLPVPGPKRRKPSRREGDRSNDRSKNADERRAVAGSVCRPQRVALGAMVDLSHPGGSKNKRRKTRSECARSANIGRQTRPYRTLGSRSWSRSRPARHAE